MPKFQDHLWGYELTYPDNWVHQTIQDTEAFAEHAEALTPDYEGALAGQILLRLELNPFRQAIEPIWSQHIARYAGLMGAKNVGSAPWHMAEASGLEAEIVLPKKENQRFWTGILQRQFIILKFAVVHPLEARKYFEPLATQIISSLRFIQQATDLAVTPDILPLPPGYAPADPQSLISDIQDSVNWRAYTGAASMAALQAFYLREAPNHGWAVLTYDPFPAKTELGFARLELRQGVRTAMLGILPMGDAPLNSNSPGSLAVKFSLSPGANN